MADLDLIYGPRQGKQQRIAVSATGNITPLSAAIVGSGWVRIQAVGADVDYQLGGASVTQVVKDQTGSGNDVGDTLGSGQSEQVYITASDTHISWDASGAGFLVLRVAGQKKTSPSP